MSENREWETQAGARTARVVIGDGGVMVGSNCGPGGAPVGAVVTHSEFLEGKYHDVIRKTSGDQLLDEMLASVRKSMNPTEA